MLKVKYHVRLSPEERTLLDLVPKGTASARAIMHANVLLTADENNPSGKKRVELNYIDSISHEAVGRLLKKRT